MNIYFDYRNKYYKVFVYYSPGYSSPWRVKIPELRLEATGSTIEKCFKQLSLMATNV